MMANPYMAQKQIAVGTNWRKTNSATAAAVSVSMNR
jgi:hypothetical protein